MTPSDEIQSTMLAIDGLHAFITSMSGFSSEMLGALVRGLNAKDIDGLRGMGPRIVEYFDIQQASLQHVVVPPRLTQAKDELERHIEEFVKAGGLMANMEEDGFGERCREVRATLKSSVMHLNRAWKIMTDQLQDMAEEACSRS
jgi:hypothetical protein